MFRSCIWRNLSLIRTTQFLSGVELLSFTMQTTQNSIKCLAIVPQCNKNNWNSSICPASTWMLAHFFPDVLQCVLTQKIFSVKRFHFCGAQKTIPTWERSLEETPVETDCLNLTDMKTAGFHALVILFQQFRTDFFPQPMRHKLANWLAVCENSWKSSFFCCVRIFIKESLEQSTTEDCKNCKHWHLLQHERWTN